MEEVRDGVAALFLEADFVKRLQELLTPGLEAVVSRAMEQRDIRIAALEVELSSTKESLNCTSEKLKKAEEMIATMENNSDRMESEMRKNCIIISGVPELPEEATDRLVLDVAQAAGISLSAGEIDRSHRLGRQHGSIDRPRAILVKLLSHNTRQRLFSSRKELSAHRVRDHPVLTPLVLENVFLSDFLTTSKQSLLYICRQLKKRTSVWAAYSTNGNVKIRMSESQPARTINNIADLQSLLGADNADLKDIVDACHSTAPRTRDETAVGATGGAAEIAPRQTPSRADCDPRSGPPANKGRRQPPRDTRQPR